MGGGGDSSGLWGQEWTSEKNLEAHFEYHGTSMGYGNINQYATGARNVVNNSNTISGKGSGGRTGYFNNSSGKLVIVNESGKIITYFIPERGYKYFFENFK